MKSLRLLVPVLAVCVCLLAGGCRGRRVNPVPLASPSVECDAFGQCAIPAVPKREPRFVLSDGTPVSVSAKSDAHLPPPTHRVVRAGGDAPPIRSYEIPGAWQELVKGFLITTPEKVGGQWHHATYLRAVRSSNGALIGVDLFESPSHRLPFATLGSGASEHFALIELAVGEAQSATVQWEGDQPVTINLYR